MAKKKKRSPEQMHRQIQDALQALPYAIEDQRKKGHPFKAGVLRYLTGPILRLMNRVFRRTRYRGQEGHKLQQTEQMRRHLEQRQAAMQHVQKFTQKSQRRRNVK